MNAKRRLTRSLHIEQLEDRALLSAASGANLLTSFAEPLSAPAVQVSTTISGGSASLASGGITSAAVAALQFAVTTSGGAAVANGSSIDFGQVIVGKPPIVAMFSVRNTGTRVLSFGSVSVPSGFRVTEGLMRTIPPNGSDSFSVQLDSTLAGTKSGVMRFTSNASGSPFQVTVSGRVLVQGPQVQVTTTSGDILASGATINFGSVSQGQNSPLQSFIVRNTGSSLLTFDSLTVPTGFRVTDGLVRSLNSGGSDRVTVAMDTGFAGSKSGTLRFTSNDRNASPFTLKLDGHVAALTAEISVTSSTGADIPNQATLDFGTVLERATGPLRTLTVTNRGTAVLTLGSVSVPSGFQATKILASSLAPGASDTLILQMLTTRVGAKAGELRFTNNDTDESPYRITLLGTVSPAAPQVTVTAGGQTLASGATLSFGTAVRGSGAVQRSFVVKNTGTSEMTLGPVTLPSGYRLVDRLVTKLRAGASDTVTVEMLTQDVGSKAGTLGFTSNAPGQSPFTLRLSGQVVASAGLVLTTSNGTAIPAGSVLDLGSVARGQPEPVATFVLRNNGVRPLRLDTLTVPSEFRVVTALPTSLAPGASASFTLSLSTTRTGVKSDLLRLGNADVANEALAFTLKGSVI